MRKIVLMTGASSGLGRLLTERLEKEGNIVYAGVYSKESESELRSLWSGRNIYLIDLDVTSDTSCQAAIKSIIKEKGSIDVLINNAGITLVGFTDEFAPIDLKNILEINTVGPFRLISQVLPFMKKKKSGQIINITSLSGLIVFPRFGLYSASKFALEAVGKALYYELKKNNIRVTQVEPGAIKLTDNKVTKKPKYLPVREKYLLIKLILPMIKGEQVAQKILDLIKTPNPPANVILGRDAKLTTLVYKVLPSSVWNKIVEKFCL